jgi:transposase
MQEFEAGMTADEGLFGSLPEQREEGRSGGAAGAPRLREARRDQVELRAVDLDSLVAADHPVRAVWAFAGGLDLRPLLAGIKAREGVPGHPPADPRILMALWLYATVDAVGSARALARLCESHVAYRWLCGGVSMNHHTLSDFRVSQEALLDRLLAQGVAGLVSAGLVTLERLAQDGVRIRASAGLGSFRRRDRLEQRLADATQRVARLRAELEADPAATTARQQAARRRAARQQEERTQAALKRLEELEARRQRREQTHKKAMQTCKPPAASTTDADASKMKMADGGSRPGYNAQFASDPQTQVIVAVALDTTGSDAGQMAKMLDQIARTYDGVPGEYLVDGGFTRLDDIEQAHAAGIKVYTPAPRNKHGTAPYAPRETDGPGVADWRRRMASPEGEETYRRRAKAECIHADLRHRQGYRLMVRGKEKVRSVLLMFALAHNMMRSLVMCPKPQPVAAVWAG